MMAPDRASELMVLGLLILDAVLLGAIELVFVTLTVGTTPLPVSALVALLTTPWLVRRAGELSTGTLGAAAPLIGWTLVVLVLGLTGPGGDVLLPGGWPSNLFVLAGLVPAGYVLGRVLRSRR
jgi:hypothetical protein